jgi:hypothetical protein
MRSTALMAAAVVFWGLTGAPPANAVPAGSALTRADTPHHVMTIDSRCGVGWHWVPEGRGRDGVWRVGHCVPDWLRDAQ